MSRIKSLFPIVLATMLGVATATVTLDPAFKEQQLKKMEESQKENISPTVTSPPGALSQTVQSQVEQSRVEESKGANLDDSKNSGSRLWSALGLWAWEKGSMGSSPASRKEEQDQASK
ncbi:hypothetical protein K432DRAFT_190878 [Lepidopterella palustris CBS 459.81]|uniref:Uncharacterized protein n=1 Tax=Lepidopterella palustris CBS 459.81 TaxID=1314670 RepID=A0A8E2EG80_9PEZI|nr:hypothetical protein K432DRAFT_190878 [Lepidopterella palustris CBS 459.81]